MKRLLLFLALLMAMPVCAQVTVSGSLVDTGLSTVSSTNTFARFELQNYTSQPRVSGTGVLVRLTIDCTQSIINANNCKVTDNSTITPSGTFWRVCFFDKGVRIRCLDYTITGSAFNFNTATPLTTTPAASSTTVVTTSVTCTFASSTTWTCTHNLGTNDIIVSIYDNNGVMITPVQATKTSSNVFTATFSASQAGSITVVKVGNFALTTGSLTLNDVVVKVPGAQQAITGNYALALDGHLRWKSGTSFFGILSHANTADRTYTFPDSTTTIGGLGVSQTWTGTNTFSGVVSLGSTVTGNIVPTTGASYYLGSGTVNFNGAYFDSFIDINPASGASASIGAVRMNKNGSIYMKTEGGTDLPIVTKDSNDILSIGGSAGVLIPANQYYNIGTLPTGTTPSVANFTIFNTNNSSPTSITNLTGAFTGQIVILICTETNTTFVDGASLALNGNLVCTADDILKLVYNGTKWIEISRSVN